MTTSNQPPPNPDWSKLNLSREHTDYIAYLHEEQTKYRMTAAVGMAIIGYLHKCGASEKEKEYLHMAWFHHFLLEAIGTG